MKNNKQPFFSVKRNVVFIAIIYTMLWGCAFPLVKICMQSFISSSEDNISKCLVAGIRFSMSGLITLIWCMMTDKSGILPKKEQIVEILLYGLLATSLQYSFTYMGLSRIDGSKGAIYDQLCVFVIVLFGGLFFKNDRLKLRKIIGCILGFFGVAVINIGGMRADFHINGEGLMLLAVICQTASYFIAKKSSAKLSAAKLVAYGQMFGGIVLIVFSFLLGGRINISDKSPALLSMAGLIVISSVAYVLSLMPLKYFPSSEISSFNLLISVFGVIFSGIILNENILKWNYFASLILISFGIFLINSKKEERKV